MNFQKIKINESLCIEKGRTLIIAEIGSNHGADLNCALDSIAAAVETGADAIKFQSIKIDELYHSPSVKTQELHRAIDLNEQWHDELSSACFKAGVLFMSSPTYLKAIAFLESVGVELYKIASAQVGVFPQLVEAVAAVKKPTLLSTGLVSPAEMETVIAAFKQAENRDYCILHCNSLYPTLPGQTCLEHMDIWNALFQCPVGFSDHTTGIAIPLAAVARGASVIEKHFTLSRQMGTPDASFSLEPDEFSEMVRGIRDVEKACNTDEMIFDIPDKSLEFKNSVRYRLVLKKPMSAGTRFEKGCFEYKRHNEGVDCLDEMFVLRSMKLKKNLDTGSLVTWDALEGI
ncbi:N-acetylneuraminate synthase family protein [Pseudodesulfovibrio piezophilus]|uniref:NeuB family protein n=1 Tax=Pseudodesulfovibrio piezophilus (strain DSM 21447 / JCM 15486 / C1TLV30) TaxID=1322246 RepID=M1WJW6_PSEP2|nr:N-acetylneuraminate synthase family protein [Pseudodesulfovibrio piezophilus]CCH48601.1 NeuB family protein [Pseudodesulfovibrio piezophilus C1TLV30]